MKVKSFQSTYTVDEIDLITFNQYISAKQLINRFLKLMIQQIILDAIQQLFGIEKAWKFSKRFQNS